MMNDQEKIFFETNMFPQMSSSHSQTHSHPPSATTNDQDELIARKKLEQKRRFQQKQTNTHTDVDSLMQSMFSDLKLQPKSNTNNSSESKKVGLQISDLANSSTNHHNQPSQTHTSVPGAADWSKIIFDDELKTVFHHENTTSDIPAINSQQQQQQQQQQSSTIHHSTEPHTLSSPRFVYPSWCSQSIVFLPLVYQQVYEATCISDVIQTSVLYPILLLSGLRQDQLSQIWSQVNLTQPGTLIKEELFMALALIGLAQNSNGTIYANEQLHHLTDVPIPHFQIQQEQPQPSPSPPPISEPISVTPSLVSVSVPAPPPPASEPTPVPLAPISVSVPPPVPVPIATVLPPTPVYQQEDFADFTSFDEIVQNNDDNNGANSGGGNFLVDFNENHIYPPDIKATSSETQSIASLDLPMPTINLNNQDDTSQKGISDNISFSSSNNNDTQPAPDTQSIHSIQSSEPSKLELTQFSFFSDDASQIDCHMSVWLRCFEKCHSILSQANDIFSSIESPTLCTEVLQQSRTRDYVHNLQEIFHVHKRIYTAACLEPTTTNQLTLLWKQIIVLWTNLQSFFSTAHLHLLNDDDVDYSSLLIGDTSSYCSICLLSAVALDKVLPTSSLPSFNTACLTFAGRLYHAPCANFYLNLIDGILPSLRRSS